MNLKIKNLSMTYDKLVIDNLNIEINNKKSIAIIGKSGSGKSTLLKILSGIEKNYTGQYLIDNKLITNENIIEFQSSIGYVFQKHNLFPHLSLIDNILIILNKIKKISIEESTKIANDVLKQVSLFEYKDKLPSNVSGGQSQRASIARALSTKPKILFLDEPTASLDPILSHEVLNTVKNIKDDGTDFIFVTHEIDFVKGFADYIIFFEDGKIIEHGNNIINNPKTDSLKEFLKYSK